MTHKSGNGSKKALSGIRVLEYADFVAGPYCSKLFADLGAEIIKIERPGNGDESRMRGPFPEDVPHAEKSALFLYLNTSKKGVTLNLNDSAGQRLFRKMVEKTDIFIEDSPPGSMDKLNLGYSELNRINPGLVMTSITPFGQSGPYSEYKSYYLNTYHSSQLGYYNPFGTSVPERPPLTIGGFAGEYTCGMSAAVATMGALYYQRLNGRGQHIDVSKQEVLIGYGRISAVAYVNNLPLPSRVNRVSGRGGIMRCKDGYMCIHMPEDYQWQALVKLIGDPDWAKHENYTQSNVRGEHFKDAKPLIEEWMSSRTKAEVYAAAQDLGCTATPVSSADDLYSSPQSDVRHLFTDIEHPAAGKLKYPTSPFLFSETPWNADQPAPLLGQHNEDIYIGQLGCKPEELADMAEKGII